MEASVDKNVEPYRRPQPALTDDNRGFWESCREHEMRLQKCRDCGMFRYFPSPVCPGCASFEFDWTPVSGDATVYTYTVVHRPPSDAWTVPYVYALVELDEGPLLPTNVVGCDPEDVSIGMRVHVVYEDVTEETTVPKFAPAQNAA